MPYYQQEPINVRLGYPRRAPHHCAWGGAGGGALKPLHEAMRRFVLGCRVLDADETPVPVFDRGSGKIRIGAWSVSSASGRGSEYRLSLALAPATVSAKSQLRRPTKKGRISFSCLTAQVQCFHPLHQGVDDGSSKRVPARLRTTWTCS